ncbi:hypothetical protein CTAYLR_008295 [Chrysophaeum taylorii]|uniref:Kinesin motor domain-containing protein n=1 Tax=Chrysophaeum taylorii TaxID=2483200 RepID=A0AAD7U897_9STRA|nr:hypothetical protein CTAYLR_008295 [Chrysophaeum taylorii]
MTKAAAPAAPSSSSSEKEVGLVCAIRVRPLKEREGRCVWKASGDEIALASEEDKKSSAFRFDAVFDATTETASVYDRVGREIVDGVLRGVNGTVFAYGQTSSGKTFTMQGGAAYGTGQRGVMHLAAEQIFSSIEQRPDFDFLIRCSYIEVYNEVLRDLLGDATSTGNKKGVQLREDPHKGVYVDGATEEIVTDAAGIVTLVARGEQARSVGATAMNERSSRSHTVFRIVVESKATAGEEADGVLVGALSLVDLAGSESVRHTGATGQRAKEGGKINQSLLTLSRVIKQLGDRQDDDEPFVNFRDSKLTRLLQPTLGGDARLAMICCVAPSEMYVEETRSTLQFAQRAAKVRLAPRVHEVLDDASQLRRVKRQLAELQRKQAEYEARGRSGKTEELSRLLNANEQLSEAVATKEAELESQIEMMHRLKRMIVLGGDVAAREDDEARLGEKGFITTRGHRRHRRARETWAPGPRPQALLFSATAKLPIRPARLDDVADVFFAEDDEDDDDAQQHQAPQGGGGAGGAEEERDLMVFEEDEAVLPQQQQPTTTTTTTTTTTKLASSPGGATVLFPSPRGSGGGTTNQKNKPSPGAISAQFSEHRKRTAAQLAALRSQLEEAVARAERAERAADDAIVELRAECAAADEDSEKRQLADIVEPPNDGSLVDLCGGVRARRERWRAALDAANDERAAAQREAYVLKQEVVELREVSESFDAHVAEIDEELGASRREAEELRGELEETRQELAGKDAEIANARAHARAADASRDAALERLASTEKENADRHDAALRRRAAAVEAVERDADVLKQHLDEARAEAAALRSKLEVAAEREASLQRDRDLKVAECDRHKRDLAVKDARVERLEQVKMTTEIFKKIQQMQLEKARAEGENKELRDQLGLLEAEMLRREGLKPQPDSPAREPKETTDESPLRYAAAALSRGGSSAASVAARLQLDELAARNAELASNLEETTERLENAEQLARDLGAAALEELGASPDLLSDAAVDSLRALVRDRVDALTTQSADDSGALHALQAKVKFLEHENLELMIEVKDLKADLEKHKTGGGGASRTHHLAINGDPTSAMRRSPSKTPHKHTVDKENCLFSPSMASPADGDKPPECNQS